MRKKVGLFSVILLISILFVATACSKNTGSDSGSSGDSGKTVIKYWSMWNTGEPQQEVIQGIIDAYEEENPDVTIDVQWMGRQVLSDVRNASLGGDGAPDLTDQSGAEVVGTLVKNELVEPLNDLLTMEIPNEGATFQDVFIDDTLSFYQQDEDTYFIPYEIITSGFHYNESLFNEHGIDAPSTWDEFIEVGKKLKDKGIAPLAQDGNIDFYNAYYYYWLTERIMGAESLLKAAGDETGETWSEPGYLEAAKKIEELVDNDFFADGYEGSQYPAAQTAWAKGDSAMILNGSWISSETSEYSSDDFIYRAFPFPEIESSEVDSDQAELYLIGWVAPEGSNVDAVQDFLAFAMQKQYQEGIVTETGNISTRNDLDAPEKLTDLKEMIVNASTYHAEYDRLQAEYPEWWKTVFLPLDDSLLFGDITADEFIDQLQVQTKEFWENQ
ncbi:ABC transporter substrate-binding protein [Pseudogracilibacillus sp. SE30717A]|uniref:ABC transporter substrate-binding protein n=1 Tax=Pseudogracilibacillus sp. SE30717A TaxID=3098293 RepID=UPI00300DD614